jgi:hypothetical protein
VERRAFLRLLGAAGAGATLDRKYFFAPAAGWNPVSLPPLGVEAAAETQLTRWRIESAEMICAVFRGPPRLIFPPATLKLLGLTPRSTQKLD